MTATKKPVVVQAEVEQESVTLKVSDSFYDDVKSDLNVNPDGSKAQTELFENELLKESDKLKEATRQILEPPTLIQRGPRPRPEQSEESEDA